MTNDDLQVDAELGKEQVVLNRPDAHARCSVDRKMSLLVPQRLVDDFKTDTRSAV